MTLSLNREAETAELLAEDEDTMHSAVSADWEIRRSLIECYRLQRDPFLLNL